MGQGINKKLRDLVQLVHVSKLEMRGFKSFGHKKESFPLSPGLTAVVGPNGCGKSNIVDALSFVLGQRSSKTLRARNFSGLIYHGSEGENGKRPAPYARVRLRLVNDDRALPVDDEKVTVSRKVDRDGKSTYRINGKRTTRQEIVDLLSGKLIGTEGYNFVMQGDVDKFIKMSSQDRRKIIDDLAGVAEFEDRKSKALSELDEVETNLRSQAGRLEELEQNMKRLERERDEALRHRELQEELRKRRATLARIEVDSCEENLEEIRGKIAEEDEKLTELEERRESLKAERRELKRKKEEYEDLIQEKRNSEDLKKVDKLNSRIDTLQERLKMVESSYKDLERNLEDLREEAQRLAQKSEEKSPLTKIEKFTSEFHALYRKFEGLAEDIASMEEDSGGFQRSLSELRGVLGELNSLIPKLEEHFQRALESREDFLRLAGEADKIEEAGSKFEQLKSELASTRARMQDSRERKGELEEEIELSEDALKEAERAAEEVMSEIEEAGRKVSEFDERIDELEGRSEGMGREISNLRDEKSDLRAEEASAETELRQARESLERYDMEKFEPPGGGKEKLEGEAGRIEGEIEGLKPINERAIENYGEVRERYDSQKEHYGKLAEERQTLLDFMNEIDREKTEVFMETFEEVSENFSDIFGDLSPGGIGRLVLENPDDPLEGGLDIEVKPQGKKLESAESLSGGEKALTGLAFIFAIQRANPSALYVLDEIDAHLDPENQKGVAEMVRSFAQESQIIVVTLRDSMMSAADKLFGVNMDDEDISHIVSVDLKKFEEEN